MNINRSTLYYKPKGESEENLKYMEKMDKYSIDHPAAGVLTMVNMFAILGITVNPKRIRRLMRKMGLEATYLQKCLSKGGRLSNTLSASNCYELIKDCVRMYGAPEIINSDQGSQYTTKEWEDLLKSYGIKISMDGRGRCKDNIWIERFWRTIKQEWVYLNPADTVEELRRGIVNYIAFYNYKRPHQRLKSLIPAMEYGLVA